MEDAQYTFGDCTSLETAPRMQLGSPGGLSGMFSGCNGLTAIPAGFKVPASSSTSNMFLVTDGVHDADNPLVTMCDKDDYGALMLLDWASWGRKLVAEGAETDPVHGAMLASWEVGSPTVSDVVARLFEDGTLCFECAEGVESSNTVNSFSYTGPATSTRMPPWADYAYADRVVAVEFGEGVAPTGMTAYFQNLKNLTDVQDIPASVVSMSGTFMGCTSLVKAPKLPEGVTNLYQTFYTCSALAETPALPDSATTLTRTFAGTALVNAPEIPASAQDTQGMFSQCTKLATAGELPEGLVSMGEMFMGCTALESGPGTIPASVASVYSAEFGQGVFRGCAALEELPVIAEGSVLKAKDLTNLFFGCTAATELPAGFNVPEGATTTGMLYVESPYSSDNPLETTCDPSDYETLKGLPWADWNRVLVAPEADYGAVDEAVAAAEAIDRALYTSESLAALDEALAAVERGLPISEQEAVDAMAKAIEDAIAALEVAVLEVVHVGDPLWVAGASADIVAQATNLAEGETVVKWLWEYSKDGQTWKKTGAKSFSDGEESALSIPECTEARRAPMAWRATATTSLGRTATTEGQSLTELKQLQVVKAGAATWAEGEDAWVAAKVDGLAPGETVASYQWYYSKDDTNWKKTGATAELDAATGELKISGFTCTAARKAPMAWSVRITTSAGRTATSEGISLVG